MERIIITQVLLIFIVAPIIGGLIGWLLSNKFIDDDDSLDRLDDALNGLNKSLKILSNSLENLDNKLGGLDTALNQEGKASVNFPCTPIDWSAPEMQCTEEARKLYDKKYNTGINP